MRNQPDDESGVSGGASGRGPCGWVVRGRQTPRAGRTTEST
ncbi:hypothetical protein P376_3429 [Streptomyces sp. HCCB10043]|nr:hypothetical protein P376_3429 [Streptomyces sp. HCCB10043]